MNELGNGSEPVQNSKLSEVLSLCLALSTVSEDAVYSSRSAREIGAALDRALADLAKGLQPNRAELISLFAPTGDLQETALANGWASEYSTLAARFDDLI